MDGINLSKIHLEFSQEGNTNGTTEEYEELDVTLESPLFIDTDGHYFVIKTKTGWSFDSIEELAELLKKCNEVGRIFFKGSEL